jgi:hypothetical protein
MLVAAKNPDLFRAWIAYFERTSDMQPCAIRFYAFVKSQSALPVPLR